MWIFDSYFKGCVELWSRERGLERISAAYPPSFYMHLKDPHAHWEMIQAWKAGSGSKSAASIASSALSRATGSTPAGKWPRRSRFRPATRRALQCGCQAGSTVSGLLGQREQHLYCSNHVPFVVCPNAGIHKRASTLKARTTFPSRTSSMTEEKPYVENTHQRTCGGLLP